MSIYCVKACADVSYADLFLAGRGYKPVEESLPVKPLITYPTDSKGVLINKGSNSTCRIWSNNIIPVAMKVVALHINSLHFLVRNLSSGWIFSTV